MTHKDTLGASTPSIDNRLDTYITNLYLDGYRDGQAGKYTSEPKQEAKTALQALLAQVERESRVKVLEKYLENADPNLIDYECIADLKALTIKVLEEL